MIMSFHRRKSRRSHSMGGDKIIATTTLTVDKKGQAHAQAVLESQAATVAELQEKVKKMRKSRENFVSFDPKPSAPPMNMMNTPTVGTPSVKRTFRYVIRKNLPSIQLHSAALKSAKNS